MDPKISNISLEFCLVRSFSLIFLYVSEKCSIKSKTKINVVNNFCQKNVQHFIWKSPYIFLKSWESTISYFPIRIKSRNFFLQKAWLFLRGVEGGLHIVNWDITQNFIYQFEKKNHKNSSWFFLIVIIVFNSVMYLHFF